MNNTDRGQEPKTASPSITWEQYKELELDIDSLSNLGINDKDREEIIAKCKSERHFNALNEVINSILFRYP